MGILEYHEMTEDTKTESKSFIKREKALTYKRHPTKTASGKRPSVDNDDEVANRLRGLDINGLEKVAAEYGLSDRFAGWALMKNLGLTRMALGNALRQKIRRQEAA